MTIQISTFNFNFNSIPVRIHTINDEVFFCLLDVASILGLGNRSISKFNFNPKGVEKLSTPTNGGIQEVVFINEPNLYRVIFRSNKAEAIDFQNWVFEEVLPQIRKTGQYSQNAQPNLPITEPKIEMELTQSQWLRLASGWFALYNCLDTLEKIHRPLELLGSRYGSTAYTQATEYQTTLGVLQRLLVPMFEQFQVDPFEDAHYHKALQTLRNFKPRGLGGLVKI